MLVDGLISADPSAAAATARQVEGDGFDGAWVAETDHDPFVACTLAAEHTRSITFGTSIAVAFARSPMTLAATANDLQQLSQGRFVLGLGSQVKAHIERRFSMPWSHPAARMHELIAAMRAIWASWHDHVPLEFHGEFYSHTLMTPMFNPGPSGFGPPRVFLAAVGERMTEVAGEVADGIFCHPFTTERYLRERTLPALLRGQARSTAEGPSFEICLPAFIVSGTTEEAFVAATAGTRAQVAFYASTPAYRPVLELHGWGELQSDLLALSKAGRWNEMGALITDDVLEAFAIVGEPPALGAALDRRFGDCVDRVSFYTAYDADPGVMASLREHLQRTPPQPPPQRGAAAERPSPRR